MRTAVSPSPVGERTRSPGASDTRPCTRRPGVRPRADAATTGSTRPSVRGPWPRTPRPESRRAVSSASGSARHGPQPSTTWCPSTRAATWPRPGEAGRSRPAGRATRPSASATPRPCPRPTRATRVAGSRRPDRDARPLARLARYDDGMPYDEAFHADPDDVRHGTDNGYSNRGCRCDRCRAAHAAYQAEGRIRRARYYPRSHNDGAYHNWGCRCAECRRAHAAHQRDYTARVRRRLALTGVPETAVPR